MSHLRSTDGAGGTKTRNRNRITINRDFAANGGYRMLRLKLITLSLVCLTFAGCCSCPNSPDSRVKAASELDPDKALATINRFLQGKPFLRAWKAEKVLAMFPRESGVEIEYEYSVNGKDSGKADYPAKFEKDASGKFYLREFILAGGDQHPNLEVQ